MWFRRHRCLPAFLVVVIAACGRESGSTPASVASPESARPSGPRADSSTSRSPALVRDSLLRAPVIPLPPMDARLDSDFSHVSPIRELSDGRVLFTNFRERSLLVGDFRTGKIEAVGRHGAGPMEFEAVGSLHGLPGDSTFMIDPGNGRRWLVLHQAKIVGTIPADRAPIRLSYLDLLGTDDRGTILATLVREGTPGSFRPVGDSMLLATVSRAGDVDTIAVMRSTIPRAITNGRAIGMIETRDRQGRELVELGMGDVAVMFEDGWIAIVRADPYRVDWRTPAGQVRIGRDLVPHPESFEVADQTAVLERWGRFGGFPAPGRETRYGWPEIAPAFTTNGIQPIALAGSEGRLYLLRTASARAPGTRYDVIDRTGALVGVLTLPDNRFIAGFGARAMYVVAVDDDGLMTIERYPTNGPR